MAYFRARARKGANAGVGSILDGGPVGLITSWRPTYMVAGRARNSAGENMLKRTLALWTGQVVGILNKLIAVVVFVVLLFSGLGITSTTNAAQLAVSAIPSLSSSSLMTGNDNKSMRASSQVWYTSYRTGGLNTSVTPATLVTQSGVQLPSYLPVGQDRVGCSLQAVSLDGVDVEFCIPFIPDHSSSAEKDDWVQSGVG